MLDAISATQVALLQDQLRLDTINQNVSNMQTSGYKRQIVETSSFDEQFIPKIHTVREQMQHFVQGTQGVFVQTKVPNELALAGEGYFEVQTDETVLYARRGD